MKNAVFLATFVTLVVALIAAPSSTTYQGGEKTGATMPVKAPPAELTLEQAFAELTRSGLPYVQNHRQSASRYWLTGHENLIQQASSTEAKRQLITRLVQQYQSTNGLSRQIAHRFPNFNITIYEGGLSKSIERAETGELPRESAPGETIEICFIPENEYSKSAFPSVVWYNAEWQALMIVAVDMPDQLLASLVYHELGHAYAHLVEHAPSSTAPPGSDAYITEELRTHELESLILDRYANGGVSLLFQSVLTRGKPLSVPQALTALHEPDMVNYYLVLDMNGVGSTMLGSNMAQLFLSYGLYCIDNLLPPSARQAEKIRLYRVLSSQL